MAATFARSSTHGALRRKSTTTSNCVLDAIIIGGGHNGLVAAAYLQRSGMNVAVFEKRHLLGGAAVTEELIPGFKFSRASYLLSLLRPQIMTDLKLKYHGLNMYFRDPQSFTPIVGSDRSLSLWSDRQKTLKDIAKFSVKDASVYCQYEKFMEEIAQSIEPILDSAPLDPVQIKNSFRSGNFSKLKSSLTSVASLIKTGSSLALELPKFWEVLTGPASKILNRWFESEPLKATLASDSVIGAMVSPFTPGSSYILLHHVMGELDGRKNSWAYVEGGMGSVTEAIANCARSYGVQMHTESPVKSILLDGGKAVGVVLENGREIASRCVLSNATPKVTFLDLLEEVRSTQQRCRPQTGSLPEDFEKEVLAIDYSSGVTKINIALSGLPDFSASLNVSSKPHPHHQATIHLNCESLHSLHAAYLDASVGKMPSQRPFIEMTIPSSVDPTIAPPGCHVASLFTQYTPYMLPTGEWTEEDKNIYCESVFNVIEEYAPGFRKLVVGKDILTPQDLERTFGLTGGNIFHGAMTLDQLYISRPVPSFWKYRSPIKGLYLCGSGTHPGGGVMGSSGRICAQIVLEDRKEPIDT